MNRSFCVGVALTFFALASLHVAAAGGQEKKQAPSKRAVQKAAPAPTGLRVYIGTYTDGASQGIYMSRLDLATGELSPPELAAKAKNPSFLALGPRLDYLYAVSEVDDIDGKKTGGVSAFAIDGRTGKLRALNQQPSGGVGPCHLAVDKTGKAVLVANYGGGSVASLPIGRDGRLGAPISTIRHEGKSVDPARQERPHAHSINLDAGNRFAFAADLGLDQVLVYRFDAASGKLSPHDPAFAPVAPGAGPRHFAFHPGGKYAYVINELQSTITAFSYDAEHGKLTEVQSIGTLPEGHREPSFTAEVVVHPSGKFVYGSNRGHDSIAIFQVDESTGKLTAAGHRPTGGKTPRNFAIDPTGKYLLAENQASNSVHVFRIDGETGALTPTGQSIEAPSPVCIKMAPLVE